MDARTALPEPTGRTINIGLVTSGAPPFTLVGGTTVEEGMCLGPWLWALCEHGRQLSNGPRKILGGTRKVSGTADETDANAAERAR